MVDINHEIKIQASPEKVFKALSHLDDLKSWHTSHIEGSTGLNGILNFHAAGKPTFLWKIVKLDPNKSVVWECIQGPGESVGTKAIYTLSKTEDNRTLVELSHTPWDDHADHFRKCNTLWGILLHHLQKYVETGKADPAFR